MRTLRVGRRVLVVVAALLLAQGGWPSPAHAQQAGGLPALALRVAHLEEMVAALVGVNADQSAAIAALQARVTLAEGRLAVVEEKLAFVSVTGTEMFITGANLHIVNGLGATNGYPLDPTSTDPALTLVNGTGNLVVGYNFDLYSSPALRSGSHNVVLGDFNYYTSFGGVLGGRDNRNTAPYGTVFGRSNQVTASYGSVVGGAFNLVDGSTGAILGGNANRASAIDATVSGGNQNRATARFSAVGGGSGVVQANEFGWSAGSFGAQLVGRVVSP